MNPKQKKSSLRHIPLSSGLDLTLLAMGIFTIALILVTGEIYRKLAVESQQETLTTVIATESQELMRQLSTYTRDMGLEIQHNSRLRESLKNYDRESLSQVLSEQYHQFYVTAGVLKLVAIWVLDKQLESISVSSADGATSTALASECKDLVKAAAKRSGHQRLKPLSQTCVQNGETLYAQILPIGLLPSGYIVVVSDPVHSLIGLETRLQKPVRILSGNEKPLYQSLDWLDFVGSGTEARYILKTSMGQDALHIYIQSDLQPFYARLAKLQTWIIALAIIATLIAMLAARYLTRKIVLEPLQYLSRQLRRGGSGRRITDQSQLNIVAVNEFVELQELYSALQDMALTDSLTNLPNRLHFEQHLERLIEALAQEQDQHVLCYMDLDRFKIVNDSCGHAAGDLLLQQLSDVFRKHVRSADLLARIGGDEFALVLAHCSREDGARIANQIRNSVKDFQFLWRGRCFSLGISIGLIAVDENSGNLSRVMSLADAACYVAKQQGRNNVHVYYENDVEISAHDSDVHWAARLQQALAQDEFELLCQPIQPCTSKQRFPEYFEILLRLRDESGNWVPSSKFLGVAERYNLMSLVDRWVATHALAWMKENPVVGERYTFAINLSGYSLVDADFLNFIVGRIHDSGIPGEQICFEITESAAIVNIQKATKFISTLKGMGCKFALDDFGTGLSSFTYLQTLRVDYIKIDGRFVKNSSNSEMDRRLLEALAHIGSSLKIATIAECVENHDTFIKLQTLGVDFAQGYYLQEPFPLQQLADSSRRKGSGDLSLVKS